MHDGKIISKEEYRKQLEELEKKINNSGHANFLLLYFVLIGIVTLLSVSGVTFFSMVGVTCFSLILLGTFIYFIYILLSVDLSRALSRANDKPPFPIVQFKDKAYKKYFDNYIHIYPVDINRAQEKLKIDVNVDDLEEYISEGILKGEYDDFKNVYIPPSVKAYRKKMRNQGYVKYDGEWITKEEKEKREEEKRKMLEEKKRRKRKELEIGLSNNFADYDPYEFEKKIAELFEKMGYSTITTPASGDYGADVIAENYEEKIVIQVKKFSFGNNVSPSDVLSTIGSIDYYNADKAIFITTSGYTRNALETAIKSDKIDLWNSNKLKEMVRKYLIDD